MALAVVYNGLSYGLEFLVARAEQSRFYGRFEGGMQAGLVDAAHWIVTNVPPGDEIAVSGVMTFRGRPPYATERWLRATNSLIDRPVQMVPPGLSKDLIESPATEAWLRRRGVRWYLWQPRVHSFWHLQTGGLEGWLLDGRSFFKTAVPTEQMRWKLYEIVPGGPVRLVEPPQIIGWPKRVPMLHRPPPRPAAAAPAAGWDWAR